MLTPLRSKREFDRVFRHCQHRAYTDNFVALACINTCETPRMGAILARKKIRTAVVRNLVKRHVRVFLRRHNPSYDLVIIARAKVNCHEKKKLQPRYSFFFPSWQKKHF